MRLIVDCDPANGLIASDVDDGLALALCWANARVEAITVVDGNAPVAEGARIAAGLVPLAGRTTPVYAGAAEPVREDRAYWRARLAERPDSLARELWAGIEPAHGGAIEEADAVAALLSVPTASTLLALGPLTNLAAAERTRPGWLAGLERVVVLGGSFHGPLGIRELNFALDPEAAQVVLGAGARLTLVPLDVTRESWITLAHVAQFEEASHPFIRHLAATARPWVRWISESRGWPGANLHDVLAAAAALRPELVSTRPGVVGVELGSGPDRSRPSLTHESAGTPIEIATGFDPARFEDFVLQSLLGYPDTSVGREHHG